MNFGLPTEQPLAYYVEEPLRGRERVDHHAAPRTKAVSSARRVSHAAALVPQAAARQFDIRAIAKAPKASDNRGTTPLGGADAMLGRVGR
ncbi:hypothetical protein GCM10010405_43270 [Streptomyces macrosporus]|uniref:Uncharacterized protein n=1 Tax=Streptomyces macrosporus TaxID=44032 RepID=A0ABN3KB55_9ACTN